MTACSWISRLKQPVFFWWFAALTVQLAVDATFKFIDLHGASRAMLGLLPALMWIFVVVAFVQAVLRSDELQQRIHMQAVSLGGVSAIVLILVVSGLERAGIYQVSLNAVWSSLLFLLLISYIVSAWRYR